MAAVILFWRVKLAFKKSVHGTKITWIGARYEIQNQNTPKAQVVVQAKQEIVDEIIDTSRKHLKENVATKKELQTYTGKLNHVAGIVETLRPFLTDLYGVLHKPTLSNAPRNCLWTKQWNQVTTWVLALLGATAGHELKREYALAHYCNKGIEVHITTMGHWRSAQLRATYSGVLPFAIGRERCAPAQSDHRGVIMPASSRSIGGISRLEMLEALLEATRCQAVRQVRQREHPDTLGQVESKDRVTRSGDDSQRTGTGVWDVQLPSTHPWNRQRLGGCFEQIGSTWQRDKTSKCSPTMQAR